MNKEKSVIHWKTCKAIYNAGSSKVKEKEDRSWKKFLLWRKAENEDGITPQKLIANSNALSAH